MKRGALLLTVVLAATSCAAAADSSSDVVASVQIDSSHDIVVLLTPDGDSRPSLRFCEVDHGSSSPEPGQPCAEIDPWNWHRRSVAASLDPGPPTSLIVVVPERAEFSLARPDELHARPALTIQLPAGPIGAMAPLTVDVIVASADQTVAHVIGCLTTGVGDGTNPVFLAAHVEDAPAAVLPTDLQTACL